MRPLIDYWVIVDTGSTDGTQERIYEALAQVPGELYARPWIDFAASRNQALELARGRGDYVLFIDADEELVGDKKRLKLGLDRYFLCHRTEEFEFYRTFLIRNVPGWRWEGAVHETIDHPQAKTFGRIEGLVNVCHEEGGARSADPDKCLKDAQVLEGQPPTPRNVFYLAQCYLRAGRKEAALKNYERRAKMGGCPQEVFWSLYLAAGLQRQLGRGDFVADCQRAHAFRPSRPEPLYALAVHFYEMGEREKAKALAWQGAQLPPSRDSLFVERWVEEWGFLFLLALLGEKGVCAALLQKNLPAERRSQVERMRLI